MVKVKTAPDVVIESVVEYFNITLDALIMELNNPHYQHARGMAIFICSYMTESSYKTIGMYLGGIEEEKVKIMCDITKLVVEDEPEFCKEKQVTLKK